MAEVLLKDEETWLRIRTLPLKRFESLYGIKAGAVKSRVAQGVWSISTHDNQVPGAVVLKDALGKLHIDLDAYEEWVNPSYQQASESEARTFKSDSDGAANDSTPKPFRSKSRQQTSKGPAGYVLR